MRYYQMALKEVKGDPTLLADIYGNMGNASAATSQIDQALDYYKKTIRILRREEDFGRLGTTFSNIGNLYLDQGNGERASHYYKKGLLLLERQERWDELSTLYGNLSLLSLQTSQNEPGFAYADKAYEFAKRNKRPERLADALHRLAKAHQAMGRIDEALRHSEGAAFFFLQLKDELGYAMTVYHQSHLYEKKGAIQEAVYCLMRVISIDEKYHLPKLNENRERLKKLQGEIRAKAKRSARPTP